MVVGGGFCQLILKDSAKDTKYHQSRESLKHCESYNNNNNTWSNLRVSVPVTHLRHYIFSFHTCSTSFVSEGGNEVTQVVQECR